MENYTFSFNDKNYELSENNCEYFINDEENPINNIDTKTVLNILNGSNEVEFDVAYYEEPCSKCLNGVKEKEKVFRFLEYHFYIFTKDSNYVISDISSNYEGKSFNKLLKEKQVDNSYIVTITVCRNCNVYYVEIEELSV